MPKAEVTYNSKAMSILFSLLTYSSARPCRFAAGKKHWFGWTKAKSMTLRRETPFSVIPPSNSLVSVLKCFLSSQGALQGLTWWVVSGTTEMQGHHQENYWRKPWLYVWRKNALDFIVPNIGRLSPPWSPPPPFTTLLRGDKGRVSAMMVLTTATEVVNSPPWSPVWASFLWTRWSQWLRLSFCPRSGSCLWARRQSGSVRGFASP